MDQQLLETIATVLNIVVAIIFIGGLVVGALKAFFRWKSPDRKENRTKLLKAVRSQWIKGVLEPTLRDAQFPVAVDAAPKFAGGEHIAHINQEEYAHPTSTQVGRFINALLRRGGNQSRIERASESIHTIFNDVSRKLLILGEPGSGKTVLLLHLAEALLDKAKLEPENALPVVLNLSSWDASSTPLSDWLISELHQQYGVSTKLAKDWIKNDIFVYLFDGLDEIADGHRNVALDSLNQFVNTTTQIAVCSRLGEYEALREKLNVNNAVEIQPIDGSEAKAILRKHLSNKNVSTLLDTIGGRGDVWNEIRKPLFINMLISTYSGGARFSPQHVAGSTEYKVQQLVVAPYIRARLRNRQAGNYSNDEIWQYLAWISNNLVRLNQVQFYVEMIQGDWLLIDSTNSTRRLSFVRFLSRTTINLDRKLSFMFSRELGLTLGHAFKRAISRISWLIPSIVIVLLGDVILGRFEIGVAVRLLLLAGTFLSIGVIVMWLFYGISTVHERTRFNQGIHNTILYSLAIGSVFGLLTTLFFGIGQGILYGLIFGFLPGGMLHVVKHYSVRLTLNRKRLAPMRYDRFLQLMVDLRLMRKVGGSAIFVHRYFMEYFADQWEQAYRKEFDN